MDNERDLDASQRLLNQNPIETHNGNAKTKENSRTGKSRDVVIKKQPKKNERGMKGWKLVPPDGGWGWLVLVGSTLVNVLVPGTVKSFGVLFVEFLEVFDASQAATAWIPALCYFLYSSLGPVSSILSVKYSYRTVTLLGGTFAAVGMVLSFFAQSVSFLYISYGILVGTGAGLSFPPTVYIVTSYFVRYRGLANGLCISGSAMGSIILPPVLRIMLEVYGYRGAVLLMGGITLNVWVAALFYDPVEKHMKKVRIDDEDEEAKLEIEDSAKPKFIISTEENSSSMHQLDRNDPFVDNSDISKNNFIRSASTAAVQNYKGNGVGRERKVSVPASRGEIRRVKSGTGSARGIINSSSTLNAVPEAPSGEFYSSRSIVRRKTPRSPSTSSFQYVSTAFHGSTLTLQPETFASSFSLKATNKPDEEVKLSKMERFFDVSLLKDPLYLIILISNSTNAISYTNFIILLPSYASSLGYDKNMAAWLLSIVSALDLVGRIGGSALSDLPLLPKEWYFIGGLFVSGLSLAILPFSQSYSTLGIYCGIFGLASGIYVGVTAVIMADMLGTERLQSTYGISLFVNGILQLIGPPLCGLWYEKMHSYVSLFCTLGVILVVGASIWGFVPCIKKKEDVDEES